MKELTPMLRQYQEIKAQHPEELLFFRLGDFYELFGDDAKVASKILNIVLTARNKGTENETPMCGLPHHALNNYLHKLIKAGKKVAICDQISDPTLPGLVKREVTRIITPGTTLDDSSLEDKTNNFIIGLLSRRGVYGLAIADLTTGSFQLTEFNDRTWLQTELFRLGAVELIIDNEFQQDTREQEFLAKQKNITVFSLPAFENAYGLLTRHFKSKNLQSFGVENLTVGIEAAALLLAYLRDTQKTELPHITKLSRYNYADFMTLDEATIRNLELFRTNYTGEFEASLLSIIDRTVTNAGGRFLRRSLLLPLLKASVINERLNAVTEFKTKIGWTRDLQILLKQTADLERLLGRVGCRRTNARDLVALRRTMQLIPEIKKLLAESQVAKIGLLKDAFPDAKDLVDLLEKVFLDDPVPTILEGGMIKDGYNVGLDELRQIARGGKEWLLDFQKREIERVGINSLKVKFNSVFGYYIEISNSNLDQVPSDYIRKQTLVNAERYITPELKEYEEKILGAEEKIHRLEYEIFMETVEKIIKYFPFIQETASIFAELDFLSSLAQLANENNYNCPTVNKGGELKVEGGRHPVIEKNLSERYVPNDLRLDHEENELLLLTGPNMSGKSSYLRQTALICLMAQIGSFVPADKAELGVVDRIFTRVGASDNLSQGVSTFMAEMQEAANILNNATRDSLIIFDELGRGTSTYDGVSIAWAIIEHLHDKLGAKTIFATHYHELTSVADKLARAQNYCVAVSERAGRVIFLHKIIKGASSESYGIEVARLAGLSDEITDRATQILSGLEARGQIGEDQKCQSSLPLPKPEPENKLLNKISETNINELTPLEALRLISDWQQEIKL